jgi:hypothetical protein
MTQLITKNKQVNVKYSLEEKKIIEYLSKKYGFATISEYIRFTSLNTEIKVIGVKN